MSNRSPDPLSYPKRGYGQDHEFYDWTPVKDRPRIEWPNGAKLVVQFIIPLEFFPLNPSGVPFKHPGAMVTPYPDLRHYTVRDYGNRVGVFRILEALKHSAVKATFAVNGEIAKRYPQLTEYVQRDGHEITAHGLSTDHIHHTGLTPAEEMVLIKQTLECFDVAPTGWMSPARTQSPNTLGLLAKAGFSYCLDWEMDQVPVTARTPNGDIALLPNYYELSDFTLLHTRRQTEESWLKQITDAVDFLLSEAPRTGGQMLGLTLTPYIMGQPFRIWALRSLLSTLQNTDGVKIMTSHDICRDFKKAST